MKASLSRFLKFTTVLVSILIFAGCSGLSTIEYHNEVVEAMNNLSTALEESTEVYDAGVPNIVTETSTIDVEGMQSAYESAVTETEAAQSVFSLQGRNEAQQAAVQSEFENYVALAEAYLSTYQAMMDYYASGQFMESLDEVATYDGTLHEQYNAFIDSNNTLVDILGEYAD